MQGGGGKGVYRRCAGVRGHAGVKGQGVVLGLWEDKSNGREGTLLYSKRHQGGPKTLVVHRYH